MTRKGRLCVHLATGWHDPQALVVFPATFTKFLLKYTFSTFVMKHNGYKRSLGKEMGCKYKMQPCYHYFLPKHLRRMANLLAPSAHPATQEDLGPQLLKACCGKQSNVSCSQVCQIGSARVSDCLVPSPAGGRICWSFEASQ